MKIRVLPDTVINQIAAGEVVERPSSVVRELVENSFDAGATEVRVYLERGGHSAIKVIDDGMGMGKDDALLCLERHATSKITSTDDLLSLATMGFRGEALPSIASVSRFTLKTRPRDGSTSSVGTEIVVHGGVIKTVTPVACPAGTEIEVRGLFFNTPVRRKFLKSEKNEEFRVKQWIMGAALARPTMKIRLYFDGKEVLHLGQTTSILERAKALFKGSLISLSQRYEDGSLRELIGLIGHPGSAVADSASFLLLVNGRVVSDKALMRAIKDGFSSTLKEREFPLGFLSLVVAPDSVDVNVHPQKSEVRFIEGAKIFVAVRDAIARALLDFRAPLAAAPLFSGRAPYQPVTTTHIPKYSSHRSLALSAPPYEPRAAQLSDQSSGALSPVPISSYASVERSVSSISEQPQALRTQPSLFGDSLPLSTDQTLEGGVFRFSALRYLGQALQCYLFAECDDRVYVVDMHAAHERYNFNLVRNKINAREPLAQILLIPEAITLGARGVYNLTAHEHFLKQVGFDVKESGEDRVSLLSIPSILKTSDAISLVREIAAIPHEESPLGRLQERIDYIAARIACHASVRSGDLLSEQEVYALFAALDTSEFSAACPHGRPVIVSFSEHEISQWFGRDS
jgi:DNA mismatch repair protein MutL